MTTSANPPAFDLTRYQDPLTIQRLLLNARTIAVVAVVMSLLTMTG